MLDCTLVSTLLALCAVAVSARAQELPPSFPPTVELVPARAPSAPVVEEIRDIVEPAIDAEELRRHVVYPDSARALGIEGTVELRVLVDETGRPVRVRVESMTHELLNRSAIDAVMSVRFTPGTINGRPASPWVSVPVRFRLEH